MTLGKFSLKRRPLDKDLFFAKDGDLFQVITNVHPTERVVALRKYDYNPRKPRGTFSWHSPLYQGFFTRAISAYSVSTATSNIASSRYNRTSRIFNVPMMEVPWAEITTYLYPDQGLQEWLHLRRETEWGRNVADVIDQFKDHLEIKDSSMGITGSLLWGSQHADSDIDLVVYGIENSQQFIRKVGILLKKSSSIHRPPPEFIEHHARTHAKKTGLNLDIARQCIAKKPYYLFCDKRFLSLGFVPLPEEINHNYEAYSFRTLVPIKVQARVREDRLGYFYPGEYKIDVEAVEIRENAELTLTNAEVKQNLTTLLLMEREMSGYYFPGDTVEIRGMLQSVRDGSQTFLQVIVGTRELYGNEWVRVLG